jgi:hypothetical protein
MLQGLHRAAHLPLILESCVYLALSHAETSFPSHYDLPIHTPLFLNEIIKAKGPKLWGFLPEM